MKKTLTILFLIGSGLIIADTIGLWHMLIVFLFVGIVPGTNLTVSPDAMLISCPILSGLLIAYSFVLPVIKDVYNTSKQDKPKKQKLVQA